MRPRPSAMAPGRLPSSRRTRPRQAPEALAEQVPVLDAGAEETAVVEEAADGDALFQEPDVLAEEVPVLEAGAEETAVVEAGAEEPAVSDDLTWRVDEAPVVEVVPGETAAVGVAGDDSAAEPSEAGEGETEWPFGERRSAARQARKPLPAALQEAVAAGAAARPERDAALAGRVTRARKRDGCEWRRRRQDKRKGSHRGPDKPPGIIRRYGSAIAIVVLFLAAGGVAAGIAAFRGPVTPGGVASDLAAANKAVLSAADFPPTWRVSDPGNDAASYGLGAALITPGTVRSWIAGHRSCSTALGAVSTSMTPSGSGLTAVAYSKAATTNSGGGLWQIADAVAFHSSPARGGRQLEGDGFAHRPAQDPGLSLARSSLPACRQDCPWSAALSVFQTPLPACWRASRQAGRRIMNGIEFVRNTSVPISFEFSVLRGRRAQVYFAASSKSAPLPSALVSNRLGTLAARTTARTTS